MSVQLWKDGPNGPEMVLIEPEVFNMSFLDAGYRFTEQHEPEKEEDEADKDTEEKPDGIEERKNDADEPDEKPVVKEEMLKRPYNKRR